MHIILGKGLFFHVWKMLHVERLLWVCRHVLMIFGQGLVSSHVEDVARREANLGSVDMCI